MKHIQEPLAGISYKSAGASDLVACISLLHKMEFRSVPHQKLTEENAGF